MGNIHVKVCEIWTSGSEGDIVQSLSRDRQMEDGWTDDRQRPITIAHLETLAQVS